MATNEPAEAHRSREAIDGAEEAPLSPQEHAAWWRAWVERGPQGPIADEPDDQLPAEP